MFDIERVRTEFPEKCTACGMCVEHCPMVPHTELKGVSPEKIMREVLDLFRKKKIGSLGRARIYSCLYCNTCTPHCPQGLAPGPSFAQAKGILQEMGDSVPQGVSSILGLVRGLMEKARPDFAGSEWWISAAGGDSRRCKTVLFASCFGLIQKEALKTTIKILQRIDPGVKVLGGLENCCGEVHLIAGQPEEAERQFQRLGETLNLLSPEQVVMFCPTCNMNFDGRPPWGGWMKTFITDFLVDHWRELGPLKEVDATVTIHDPCHFVRGARPPSLSTREILQAIPGIRAIEMKNSLENALCCGGYAIAGTGGPGMSFRDRRLMQAKETSAEILTLYCPGCHMVLGPEGPKHSLRVESILTLLGRSLGLS